MLEDTGKAKIREATVAGLFYPEGRAELEKEVRSLLAGAHPVASSAAAILAPHAGLAYSGDLAALAWKSALGRRVRHIVILAPLHRSEESLVYLPESELFETPLGAVRVDRELVSDLSDCGTVFQESDIPHFEEHGIEVQLPFMRLLFPEAKLVPVILGKPSPKTVRALAAALGMVFGPNRDECLFVLSSDLAAGAEALGPSTRSSRVLDLIQAGDWQALLEPGSKDEPGACGGGCIAAYMSSPLAEGTKPVLLGRHDSSACRETREERLVEYAALAFVRPGRP
ncbi:MAG TPA: AmmeMemoRadiSam system protein B [Rectinemataceae bacterium]|nr:AmmeMemoRadiSam system protein B [Rectinemataceae bacterium]